ncbi:MAG: sulfite exporter TauE/SafE family protein [Spirochaetaceae bacterium]|jgi:sulfite exporter TauE/SafE/copper chaperone CopZ/plastocyanin domain-containing protein|nr:sulfite exporter TauE/SafE family protein [Spirochaetaceae bacterium]
MKTETIYIGGMSCVNCQSTIEKKLKSTAGIESAVVSYSTSSAELVYDESLISFESIKQIITNLHYTVLDGKQKTSGSSIASYAIFIISLYVLLQHFGASRLSSAFPLAQAGMGYGMLFVIGLITSVHCVAMCGGINLSQCISEKIERTSVYPAALYNAGRVVSYTISGIIVGALGKVITVNGAMQGVVQIAAGVFMILMGINMLGIFPGMRRINFSFFTKKIDRNKIAGKSPLIVGLLNGLMPCGPLQTMQLYALSTASPVAGGIAMFVFSMGTVPLMFGLGALSSFLSRQFTGYVMKAGAVLVAVLGLTMLTNGYSLSGLPALSDVMDNKFFRASYNQQNGLDGKTFAPVIENGVQIVNSTLSPGRYPPITVQADIPVKWVITAPNGSINGCNNRMIIREYGIEYQFKPGQNIIEFMPSKTGRFTYTCWMGMIRSTITVVEKGADSVNTPADIKPAGITIPSDTIAAAVIEGGIQTVSINLSDEGFEPAIVVMQKNVPAKWTINNNSLDPGNSELVFPAYYLQQKIENGENTVGFVPSADFEFSTIDNIFYGFVKIVDDINNIDAAAIKKEAGEYETLIYPDEYFAQAPQAPQTNCCQ